MKRIISLSLALIMAFTCCFGLTSAVEMSPMASITISSRSATMKAGSSSGELRISYSVTANMSATSLGVSSIVIYKSNGTYVTTITGTTSNGLVSSGGTHMGTYSYIGTSGVSYYADVTVFAATTTDYDSKTIMTPTVKAP